MINGLEGIPGSGKSYEAVAYHVLPALQAGRKVITNLPLNIDALAAIDPSYRDLVEVRTRPTPQLGDWNAANIAEQEAFQLWTDKEPIPQSENVFTFGTVWDYYSEWRGSKNQGPLYVIDECHVALPKLGTPESVVQWFKLHRHYNADVLLMTQSFRDINQPIAQLIATLIKCRKADILGRKDSYIRKVHAGYRGAVIQTDEREYKSQYFGLYRSNTQSSGSAESGVTDVSPMIVKFNRFKKFWLLLSVLLVIWAFWPDGKHDVWGRKIVPSPPVKPRVLGPAPGAVATPVVASSAPASVEPKPKESQQATAAPAEAAPQTKEPLFGKQLHVAGHLSKKDKSVTLFIVSDGTRRMFEVTSDDLEDAGYSVKRLANCMVTVKFDGVVRPVTCDAPYLNTGGQDRPLVVDAATGSRSDGRNTRYSNAPMPQEVAQVRQEQQQQAGGYLEALARRNSQVRSVLMDN
ncbi:zonular occludens toxin [Comamonas thiooxydans]|uniref:zonular occludens toxin domain-containing protein n=1 Tax=Comamonas thiooxydans TaxID=363952 RepID=UPI000A2DE176|nr:zonular occludens toxin domain-containing protein [Comamonas thiooxydans]BDR08716.1 zonular occludens toxin [Comamonas thiooxydans]